jgi:hypothetical protein
MSMSASFAGDGEQPLLLEQDVPVGEVWSASAGNWSGSEQQVDLAAPKGAEAIAELVLPEPDLAVGVLDPEHLGHLEDELRGGTRRRLTCVPGGSGTPGCLTERPSRAPPPLRDRRLPEPVCNSAGVSGWDCLLKTGSGVRGPDRADRGSPPGGDAGDWRGAQDGRRTARPGEERTLDCAAD